MTLTYAKMIEDSISSDGIRISSIECRFPRIILSEQNTHRQLSRNTSSSRAIPVKKLIKDVKSGMFVPSYWGKAQPGMQAHEELTGWRRWAAKKLWTSTGHLACNVALLLNKIGLHKQIANRMIEPWSYVTVLVTSTHWTNYLSLRNHPDAQPEINELAGLIYEELKNSEPRLLQSGEWHTPYVLDNERAELSQDDLIKISVARSASTSYQTVDGKVMTKERALALYDKLLGAVPLHASPAEHQATPDTKTRGKWKNPTQHGNFSGWIQFRKTLTNEYEPDAWETTQ